MHKLRLFAVAGLIALVAGRTRKRPPRTPTVTGTASPTFRKFTSTAPTPPRKTRPAPAAPTATRSAAANTPIASAP